MNWEVFTGDAVDTVGSTAGIDAPLWLFLPGAYMKPVDFINAGFPQALRRRGHRGGIELLAAGVDEVADGSALAALRRRVDVATSPVRLCGISLGGHLSLALLARAHDDAQATRAARRIDRVCLLAPYLGPRAIAGEVAAADGITAWARERNQEDDADIDFAIWRWLAAPRPEIEMHLGYGADDRFARAHALVAATLPPQRVTVLPGGHDWPVWAALWTRHLEHSPP